MILLKIFNRFSEKAFQEIPDLKGHFKSSNLCIIILLLVQSGLLNQANAQQVPKVDSGYAYYPSGPAAILRNGNRIDAFFKSADDHLWTSYTKGEEKWSVPIELDSFHLKSKPSVVSNYSNRIDVFYKGSNGHLWTSYWNGDEFWYTATDLGGVELKSAPAAVSAGKDRLFVFYKGPNGHLWENNFEDGKWKPEPVDLGGVELRSSPSAVSRKQDMVDVFFKGPNDRLWTIHWDNGKGWSTFSDLEGTALLSNPSVVAESDSIFHVFFQGLDNKTWVMNWSESTLWGKAVRVGQDEFKYAPSVVYSESSHKLEVIMVDDSNRLQAGSFGKHGNNLILEHPYLYSFIDLSAAWPYTYDAVSGHWVINNQMAFLGEFGDGMDLEYKLTTIGPAKEGAIQCKIDGNLIEPYNNVTAGATNPTGTFHIPHRLQGSHTVELSYLTDIHTVPNIHGGGFNTTSVTSAQSESYFSPSCDWSNLVNILKSRLSQNQGYDLGHAVPPDVTSFGLQHYQKFNNNLNSIEMHSDGSIYISCMPTTLPTWYDPYYSYDHQAGQAFNILTNCPPDGSNWEGFSLTGGTPGGDLTINGFGWSNVTCNVTGYFNPTNNSTWFFIQGSPGNWKAITSVPTPGTYWVSYRIIDQMGWQLIQKVEGPTLAAPTIIDDHVFFISLDGFTYLKYPNFTPGQWASAPAFDFPPGQGAIPRWYHLELPAQARHTGYPVCDWVDFLTNGDGNPDDLAAIIRAGTTQFDNNVSYTPEFGKSPCLGIPCGSLDQGNTTRIAQATCGCPEWETVLPVGNIENEKKDSKGVPYSWNSIMRDAQAGESMLKANLAWNGHPDNSDRKNTVPWVTSFVEGQVVNSWLGGGDYSGDHMSKPDNYWLGNRLPELYTSDGCGTLHTDGSICSDYCYFINPDPEYEFLRGGMIDQTINDPFETTFLPCEIQTWCIPTDYRPEPGDRILTGGRWIVDCGHGDYHTEIHPIEMFSSSHAFGGNAVSKVVVTGAWNGGQMQFEVWPPVRPMDDFHLRYSRNDDALQGLTVTEAKLPADNPNHILVTIQAPFNQNNTGGWGDVYYNTSLRLATKYTLWWEENAFVTTIAFRPQAIMKIYNHFK